MTPAQALKEVKLAGKFGRFEMPFHARLRGTQRSVQKWDVQEAFKTATTATAQANGRWLISGGVDLDGDKLKIIVVFDGGVVVVTVIGDD